MLNSNWIAYGRWAAALALLLATLCVAPIQAQEQPPMAERIALWDRTAKRAESLLESTEQIATDTFERLRAELIEQRTEALDRQKALESQLQPLQSQLAALGEPPDADTNEAPDIAAKRGDLARQIADLQSRLKEVGLAATRAGTLQDQMAQRQREQFADTLFTSGPGLFDEGAWSEFLRDAGSLWRESAEQLRAIAGRYDASGAHAPITLAFAVAGLLAFFGRRRALRAAGRMALAAEAARIYAVRIAYTIVEYLLRAGALPLAALLLALVIDKVADPSPLQSLLLRRIVETTAIIAAVVTLARMALLAEPKERRAFRLDPPGGALIAYGLTAFAAFVALNRLSLEVLDAVDASTGALTIVNAVFAALAGGALLLLASQVRTPRPEPSPQGQLALDELAEDGDPRDALDWRGGVVSALRVGLLAAAGVLLAGSVFGYFALARFVMDGVAMSALVGAGCVLIYSAAARLLGPAALAPPPSEEEGAEATHKPPAERENALVRLLIALTLALLAAPLLGLIWGASHSDILSVGAMLFDGVRIGDSVFSFSDVLLAILVLIIGLWATRLIQRVANVSVLPSLHLATGARTAISAGLGYVGFFITSLLAVSAAGFDLSNLAIIAGALSVGIGFGLQNVVNNFVSGLILLIERPIQPGDWIEVGGHSGHVKEINVRSTEIVTFDRASVIVPNSELISASVVNWTHKNLVGRVIVGIGVSYDSDPDQVAGILTEIATTHPLVLKTPPPFVNFKDFGASSLDFELRCYLRDVNSRLSVASEMRFEILRRLREAGIEIPFPQRVVHIAGAEAAEAFEIRAPLGKAPES